MFSIYVLHKDYVKQILVYYKTHETGTNDTNKRDY